MLVSSSYSFRQAYRSPIIFITTSDEKVIEVDLNRTSVLRSSEFYRSGLQSWKCNLKEKELASFLEEAHDNFSLTELLRYIKVIEALKLTGLLALHAKFENYRQLQKVSLKVEHFRLLLGTYTKQEFDELIKRSNGNRNFMDYLCWQARNYGYLAQNLAKKYRRELGTARRTSLNLPVVTSRSFASHPEIRMRVHHEFNLLSEGAQESHYLNIPLVCLPSSLKFNSYIIPPLRLYHPDKELLNVTAVDFASGYVTFNFVGRVRAEPAGLILTNQYNYPIFIEEKTGEELMREYKVMDQHDRFYIFSTIEELREYYHGIVIGIEGIQ